MNGPEHYREAERLLVHVDRSVVDQFGDGAEWARQELAQAQVHATLALAAATAMDGDNMPAADWDQWRDAASAYVRPQPAGSGGGPE